jgi:ParB family transcriptional regulator, chromosome partitioning protein
MVARADKFSPSEIAVSARARPLSNEGVERLMASIRAIGLQTPLSVRIEDRVDEGEVPVLIAGRHRLEACRRLGLPSVPVMVHDGDELDARMWEIAENLHRSDLTALEQANHIEEWRRLMADKVAQSAPPLIGGSQPTEKGIRKVAHDLGVSRRDVQRAEKVAKLAPEAKAEAVACGLDDNRTALLAAAAEPSAEAQVQLIKKEANRKAAEKETREADRFVARTLAEQFAEWLMARVDLNECAQLHTWLAGTKGKDVSAALKRMEMA